VTGVRVREHETIDEALKRFKKECEKDGVMTEIKKREYYESPGVRRRKKQKEADRKRRRRERKYY
jgi:small subunit ribosomal protein S21